MGFDAKTAIDVQAVEYGSVLPTLSYFGVVRQDDRYVHTISLRFDGWIEESSALRVGQLVRK